MTKIETNPLKVHVTTPDGFMQAELGPLLKEKVLLAVPGTPGYGKSGVMSRPEFFITRLGAETPGLRQSGRGYAIGVNSVMAGEAEYWLRLAMKGPNGTTRSISMDRLTAILNLTQRLNGQGVLGPKGGGNWFASAAREYVIFW